MIEFICPICQNTHRKGAETRSGTRYTVATKHQNYFHIKLYLRNLFNRDIVPKYSQLTLI